MCLSDEGFGGWGWGRERPVKQRATDVNLWRGWTNTVSVYKLSPQNIAVIRRVGMTVELHPSPTAPEADIKTSPPHYRQNQRLYRRTCFQKFPKLSGTKVQNVRIGVLGFLTSTKEVNTWNDNLRVHTASFDTRTTSVGTTAHWGGWSGVATGVWRSRVPLVIYIMHDVVNNIPNLPNLTNN